MQRGVLASDVFLLFLTNSALTRPFCLKEVRWAVEAGKPIIIVVEEDHRFYPFDLHRWTKDLTRRNMSTWPHTWERPDPLPPCNYENCPKKIKDEIHRQFQAGLPLPYRRREYESRALVREVLYRASLLGCNWAKHLPPVNRAPLLQLDREPGTTYTLLLYVHHEVFAVDLSLEKT